MQDIATGSLSASKMANIYLDQAVNGQRGEAHTDKEHIYTRLSFIAMENLKIHLKQRGDHLVWHDEMDERCIIELYEIAYVERLCGLRRALMDIMVLRASKSAGVQSRSRFEEWILQTWNPLPQDKNFWGKVHLCFETTIRPHFPEAFKANCKQRGWKRNKKIEPDEEDAPISEKYSIF